jgi:hypothetical protein
MRSVFDPVECMASLSNSSVSVRRSTFVLLALLCGIDAEMLHAGGSMKNSWLSRTRSPHAAGATVDVAGLWTVLRST